MRNLTLPLLILFGLSLASYKVQAQSTRGAVDYMDEMFTSFNKPKDDIWQYMKAITRGKGARKVENKRQNLLNELKNAKNEVERIGNFQSDDSLKNAVVKYLDLSYTVLKEDFGKILDMEDIVEQSYDLMEAYLLAKEMANDKLQNSFDEVVLAEKEFANKHNITLLTAENDKTSEKIELAGKTLKYYNKIYLIFFGNMFCVMINLARNFCLIILKYFDNIAQHRWVNFNCLPVFTIVIDGLNDFDVQ